MEYKKPGWDEQYYHGWTNKYPFTDVVSFIMRNFSQAEPRSSVRVLDLGCGGGHHLTFLAQEGFEYHGVDGSQRGLQFAHERLQERSFSTENVILATFDALPYPDDHFDAVIDRGALVCNRGTEIRDLLKEIRRVMKPGAKMLSTIIHEDDSSRDGATDLGGSDYTNFPGRLKDAGVLHFTSAEDAASLFSEFSINDLQLQTSRSAYPPAKNPFVSAWMVITCSK
jgi:SAM-dependent methyltransferase